MIILPRIETQSHQRVKKNRRWMWHQYSYNCVHLPRIKLYWEKYQKLENKPEYEVSEATDTNHSHY